MGDRQHLGAQQQRQQQQQQHRGGADVVDDLDAQLEADLESEDGAAGSDGDSSYETGSESGGCESGAGERPHAAPAGGVPAPVGPSSGDVDELPLLNAATWTPDHTFKVLLVGDSGVGKTCLVMRFIADRFEDQLPSTVGVDFAIKRMVVHDAHIKLTIWDTAGQERFRALTSTFYRGAAGIIFVYDVTRRETLTSLSGSWMDELASYDPHPEVARMVVANKVDQHDARQVTWQEGAEFAQQHGCLFVETSAKHNVAVGVAFEELVLRILDTPALLAAEAEEQRGGKAISITSANQQPGGMAISCSC